MRHEISGALEMYSQQSRQVDTPIPIPVSLLLCCGRKTQALLLPHPLATPLLLPFLVMMLPLALGPLIRPLTVSYVFKRSRIDVDGSHEVGEAPRLLTNRGICPTSALVAASLASHSIRSLTQPYRLELSTSQWQGRPAMELYIK